MAEKIFRALTSQDLYEVDVAKGPRLDGTTPEEVLVMGEIEVASVNELMDGRATQLAIGMQELEQTITELNHGRQPLPVDIHRSFYRART